MCDRRVFLSPGVRAMQHVSDIARFVVVTILVGGVLLGAGRPVSAEVEWRSEGLELLPEMTPGQVGGFLQGLIADGEDHHVVVALAEPLTAQVRQQLADAGVRLLASLSDNAFFAAASADSLSAVDIGRIVQLRSAQAIDVNAKLHPMLVRREIPDYAVVGQTGGTGGVVQDIVAAYVLFHRDVPLPEGVRLARSHGAMVRSRLVPTNVLVIELPESRLYDLADEDAVQWVEPPLPRFEPINDSNRNAIQANEAQALPFSLDGSGVTVLVFDAGTALASHADFGGRLTARDGSGLGDHPTHVAGTIGGDGTASAGLYTGMAPGVTIESFGFQPAGGGIFLYNDPGDIAADYGSAINNFGAVLANNSIGTNTCTNGFACEITGDYGITAQLIDSIVRGSLGAPIRIMWANGNERTSDGTCNRCIDEGVHTPEGYHSTAPPACAKNHLTVGAMNSNDDSVTNFTSWGPCDDGRLKPDVSAPGCESSDDNGVTSCSSSGNYSTKCGTSMASPTTCGAAALLLEDFRNQFPALPDFSPSTLKVLLAHTAKDLQNVGPDYKTGYGLIQITDAVVFMRSAQFTEQAMSQGATHSVFVEVEPGTPELRFTLAWDDAPGTPNVSPALVNDLDLRAVSPSLGTVFPWTLDPDNPGTPAIQTRADHVNNIEQVVVDAPEAGTWTIQVIGFDVPEGPQLYSLAGSPSLDIAFVAIGLAGDVPELVPPAEPLSIDAVVTAVNDEIVEGSAQLFYRFGDGAYTAVPLTPAGEGLTGTVPGAGCNASPQFYLSIEGANNGVVFSPPDGPDNPFTYGVGAIETFFADDFESNQGWTVANGAGLTDGSWDRGVPAGGGDRGDPAVDADGSGQCFLTDNIDGNSDVDGGSTTLTSPLMDASSGDPLIGYSRWYSNSFGDSPFQDTFVVEVSDDGGSSWVELETVGPAGGEVSGGWFHKEFLLADIPDFQANDQFRIRFTASDTDPQSVVEAAIDAVELSTFVCDGPDCDGPGPGGTGDLDCDGSVGPVDLAALLVSWGPCDGCPADLDGDGDVGPGDLAILLVNWG